MAFLLRDLPTGETFDRFAARYPALDPTATECFLRVLRLGSDYLEFLDGLLAEHGLRHGRWITLILLMREADGTARPSELAEKQGVSRATMSGLLDTLEGEGLIERRADDADGRTLLVTLTRRGRAKLDRVMPEYYGRVAALMNQVDRSALEVLVEALRAAPRVRGAEVEGDGVAGGSAVRGE